MNEVMKIKVDGQTIEIEYCLVTPELASLWLGRNTDNRAQRKRNLAKIGHAMELGEFKFAGDPIRISKTGKLLDGQHRLKMIVETGKPQKMLVMKGFDESIQLYVDQGDQRNAGDQIRIAKVAPSSTNDWAAIARLIIRWDADDILTNILIPSNAEVVYFCEEHHDQMLDAVFQAKRIKSKIKARASVAGALHFMAGTKDPVQRTMFFHALADGAGLQRGSPILALRNVIIERKQRDRLKVNEELALFVRAWNAIRKGENLVRLQLPREGLKPQNFEIR